MAVGDVVHQNPVLLELVKVQVGRLPREHVNGDGVRGEGFADDHSVPSVFGVAHPQAGVAQLHIVLARAVAQVGEEVLVARDRLDGRVDLVVGPPLSGLGVARHHTRPQPEHGHLRFVGDLARQEFEELPERPRGVVVSDGLGGLGSEDLRAVVGVADDECVVIRDLSSLPDVVDPEEAPVLVDASSGVTVRVGDRQEEHRYAQPEAQRATGEVSEPQAYQAGGQADHRQPDGVPVTGEVEVSFVYGPAERHHQPSDYQRQREVQHQRRPTPPLRALLLHAIVAGSLSFAVVRPVVIPTVALALDETRQEQPRQKQARYYYHQGILDDRVEGDRCYQRVEDSAEHTSYRHPQVELRQVPRRRPVSRHLSVQNHRHHEEAQQVQPYEQPERVSQVEEHRDDQHRYNEGQHRDHAFVDQVRHPLARREDNDEREEVQRERYHPQEGYGGYVGGYKGCDPQHQARRHERQPYPPSPAQPGRPARETASRGF